MVSLSSPSDAESRPSFDELKLPDADQDLASKALEIQESTPDSRKINATNVRGETIGQIVIHDNDRVFCYWGYQDSQMVDQPENGFDSMKDALPFFRNKLEANGWNLY